MLKPFDLGDFDNPEDAFEVPNFSEKPSNIWIVRNDNHEDSNLNRRKDYDKNICRYIVRQIIRSFVSEEFEQEVLQFCNNNKKLYNEAKKFFINQIEYISGHRKLKELLIIYKSDSEELKNKKTAFRKFCRWYLENRALRFILSGNM